MKRNIWLLRIISSVRWFLLIMPVIFIFYRSHGLSLFQTFTIQAFFSLSILTLEIPTGYLGDRYGWNKSLLMGSYAACLGLLILTLASSFFAFLVAEFFMSAAYCLFSGSDSALLYESLVESGKEHEYIQEEGLLLSSGYVSEGVAAILGGFLAYVDLHLPFWINFYVCLLLIPLTYTLVGSKKFAILPPVMEVQGIRRLRSDFFSILLFIKSEPIVRWVSIFSGFIGFLALASAWLMQSYFKLTGFELYYIGFIWALLNFSRSISASFAGQLNSLFGTKQLFVLLPIILSFSFILMGVYVSLFALVFGFLIQAARGVQLPLVFSIINNRTSSDIRAAVLSFEGMMMRVFFVVLGPLLGVLCDMESIHVAFYAMGILSLLGGFLINNKIKTNFEANNDIATYQH